MGNYQGYKFGRIGFVLHLGLPFPAFGLFLLVFNVLLCVCSFCFYFADAFGNAMWSDHRAAVSQGSGVLHYLASSLLAFASRAPSNSVKYFSSYNRWKSQAREHSLTAFPVFPFHVAIYLLHLMTEAKAASPLESVSQSIA